MDQHLRATFGQSLDDYDVLHQISVHGGPIRMGDLAENLLVANSSCNRIVGRLVDGGFAERRHGNLTAASCSSTSPTLAILCDGEWRQYMSATSRPDSARH